MIKSMVKTAFSGYFVRKEPMKGCRVLKAFMLIGQEPYCVALSYHATRKYECVAYGTVLLLSAGAPMFRTALPGAPSSLCSSWASHLRQ